MGPNPEAFVRPRPGANGKPSLIVNSRSQPVAFPSLCGGTFTHGRMYPNASVSHRKLPEQEAMTSLPATKKLLACLFLPCPSPGPSPQSKKDPPCHPFRFVDMGWTAITPPTALA